MNEESYLVSQERCPNCANVGNDISADNLAIYSDGHCFCFSCLYYKPGDKLSSFRNKATLIKDDHSTIYLPEDCDVNYPSRALEWISQYELNVNDLLNNHVLWSEYKQRLIFPIYDNTGLLAYQGRYFGNETKPKWDTRGDLKNIFHILGKGNSLVLTEDIVSAIKVSKITRAMPLFGCSVGTTRFKRIKTMLGAHEKVFVWLDPDKRKEAVLEARRGILCGINVSPIFSDKDPKEMKYEQIKQILQISVQ